jgi:hypothetical protein
VCVFLECLDEWLGFLCVLFVVLVGMCGVVGLGWCLWFDVFCVGVRCGWCF